MYRYSFANVCNCSMTKTESTDTRRPEKPSRRSILNALKMCSRLRDLRRGKDVHAAAVESGHSSHLYVASTLVDMYAKCGSLKDAREVFDEMQKRDVVSWNVLIMGYAENGKALEALELFQRMDCVPDPFTCVAALKACTAFAEGEEGEFVDGKVVKAAALERVVAVHETAKSMVLDSDLTLGNSLVNAYAKCGWMVGAANIFASMRQHDVVSWTALILGYAENGEGNVALDMFHEMLRQGCAPNYVSYVAALNACSTVAEQEAGKPVGENLVKLCSLERTLEIHRAIVESGYDSDVKVANTLIVSYAKCGSIGNAQKVFDGMQYHDVVSWTVLIQGYAENGAGRKAMDLYHDQLKCSYDSVTFLAALKACICLALDEPGTQVGDKFVKVHSLEKGMAVHARAVEKRCDTDIRVASTLVDMYANCCRMSDARKLFEAISNPNVVSWTALILGYVDNGEAHEALNLFCQMCATGRTPETFTFFAALKACGMLGAFELGKALHANIQSRGFDHNPNIATALIECYTKCWSMVEAKRVFDGLATKDIVAWTTLLAGYRNHGQVDEVLDMFDKMSSEHESVQPDHVIFLCVLTACSHAGLLDKASECFESMSAKYGLSPRIEHYTCMVDMLGRANKLDDALEFMNRMPMPPDAVTWTTILAACQKWRNVQVGRLAFQSLLRLNPQDSAAYVLMSDIYRSRGMSEEQLKVGAFM